MMTGQAVASIEGASQTVASQPTAITLRFFLLNLQSLMPKRQPVRWGKH